jgi:3-hydroxybutyryl-CoA dehydrogenase
MATRPGPERELTTNPLLVYGQEKIHQGGCSMEIKKIGVIGAGTMGNGIAQVAAQIGCEVIMRDVEERFVQSGLKNIDRFLSKGVEKGKMTADQKGAILGRIQGTTNMADLADVDFVIEAVIENMDLKRSVFKELDGICRAEVVLATNTSSMSITEIAVATQRPEKVVGMHFFNPVPLMRLVEVIRGFHTNDEAVQATMDLAKKMGKETVEVKIDSPGFIVNRIMIPHMLEAINIVQEGVATKEDVDKAVKLGLNYPMGPFELMDLTGVDICKFVADYFYKELNKEGKWVAPTLLKNMIRANRLGRKTGAGWYDYKK